MTQPWTCTMNYRRGAVVLVVFPNSDLRSAKKRPALLVQDHTVVTDQQQTLVACITSKLHRKGETRVRVNANSSEGRQTGLLMDSVIVADNLATVPHWALKKQLGSYPCMERVDQALRKTLGL